MTTHVRSGYFTRARVERLFRQSVRDWGRAVIGGHPSIGCPCCGRSVVATTTTRPDVADDAVRDALGDHLRADCPHSRYAYVLLDEPAPENP